MIKIDIYDSAEPGVISEALLSYSYELRITALHLANEGDERNAREYYTKANVCDIIRDRINGRG